MSIPLAGLKTYVNDLTNKYVIGKTNDKLLTFD